MKKGCLALAAVLLIVAALGVFAGPSLVKQGLRLFYPRPYEEIISREAGEFALEQDLVFAVIKTESNFDEDAQSHAGAKGLMQLTPATFQWISSLYPFEDGEGDILDPADNIHCGCALLRLLLNQYGDLDVALCAYNAGMGNVSEWLSGGEYSDDGKSLHTIPFPETDSYVKKVKKAMKRYQELYEDQS